MKERRHRENTRLRRRSNGNRKWRRGGREQRKIQQYWAQTFRRHRVLQLHFPEREYSIRLVMLYRTASQKEENNI